MAKKEAIEKLEKELGEIGVDLKNGDLRQMAYDQIEYADKWNVRDPKLYAERARLKLTELEADGMIRTPLVAVYMEKQDPATKPILVVGHVRIRAVELMKTENPALFAKSFTTIPVMVLSGVTEDQRHRLVLDHGSEIALKEHEVYNEYKKLCRCGYTQKQISNMLSKLFYKLARAKHQMEFDKRVTAIRHTGSFFIGKSEFLLMSDVAQQTWRGHMQYFERIMKSPPCVEKEWVAFMTGDANAVYPDRNWVQVLVKLSAEEAATAIAEKRAARGEKKTGGQQIWGAARLIQARAACQSHYYQVQLDAALGKEEAAKQLPGLEDELIQFEAALSVDAAAVWKLIDEFAIQAHDETD